MADTEVQDMAALTALDRCDRCGARAVHVTEHQGGDLLWCEHHHREHKDAIAAKALDTRETLGK